MIKKTQFHQIHTDLGGKIVEFAGYYMPVQYQSIIAEHKAVRNSVGVFDVSHMGEVFIEGDKALEFVQHLTINDASVLYPGRVQYSAMCYTDGGIVDDLLVYHITDTKYMLVVNASNLEKDVAWMNQNNNFGVSITDKSEAYSLLAVQGPDSKKVIEILFGIEVKLDYYHFQMAEYKGVEVILSRTGYTGELGYELYFAADEKFAHEFWAAVFEAGKEFGIMACGLGCRDSLRLEMGYCLYGNDIDATTNPLDAGLAWITKLKKPSFLGKDAIMAVKANGSKRRLTPLLCEEKAFPRHGYEMVFNGNTIGYITSGTVSPILEKGIALAYIQSEYAKEGNELFFLVRGKEVPVTVVKLPFIQK